jgi:hypothetical protein
MRTRIFLPTARQLNWLLIVGFSSIGYALYLRYLAIELSTVSLACEGGLDTWLCLTRHLVLALFKHWVFGTVAIGAAVLNLIRPSIVLLSVGLAATGFGIVLYNTALSALAAALLILSLARPVSAAE